MTDRELLELAAKAYWGDEIDDVVSVEWSEQDAAILYTHADNQDHNGQDRTYRWNPLAEDADALQLAVKLDIDLMNATYSDDGINGQSVTFPIRDDFDGLTELYDAASEKQAATRRVITRAAAEIGKAL